MSVCGALFDMSFIEVATFFSKDRPQVPYLVHRLRISCVAAYRRLGQKRMKASAIRGRRASRLEQDEAACVCSAIPSPPSFSILNPKLLVVILHFPNSSPTCLRQARDNE